MEPFLADPDVQLFHGDALEVLRELPDESVHACITSPPFYGLRDYGVEGQIGLEETPEQWVEKLVAVFREVRRVLREDGTLWLEVGDSYASSSTYNTTNTLHTENGWKQDAERRPNVRAGDGCKPKDLIGAPWLLAFALRADGWYLRSEIIWSKPNPMPESVTDRPTTAHSRIFLLAKNPRYYFDAEAVREAWSPNTHSRGQKLSPPKEAAKTASGHGHAGWTESVAWSPADDERAARLNPQAETLDGSNGEPPRGPDGRRATHVQAADGSIQHRDGERWPNPSGRNVRSVWEIATEPFPEAHFATFPQALVRRCILAGSSERGCCPECGAPWVREVEREIGERAKTLNPRRAALGDTATARGHSSHQPGWRKLVPDTTATTGWRPSCECESGRGAFPLPCTVLDPFMGSGTTAFVARKLGRRAIGIDLNAEYLEMASWRLAQQSLFATEASA